MTHKLVWSLILTAAICVLQGASLCACLHSNLATVILNRALWQDEVPAVQRQRSLRLAAQLLASPSQSDARLTTAPGDPPSMLYSIFVAEHFRREGDLGATAAWLRRAASAPPYPCTQAAIRLPSVVAVATDGSLVIAGDSPLWAVRPDTEPPASIVGGSDGIGVFTLGSDIVRRPRAAFYWNSLLSVPYHHRVSVTANVSPGCSLMLETVADGKRQRHFVHPGTGGWDKLEATIQGNNLRFIDLLLDLDATSDSLAPAECTAEIASVVFRFDRD